MQVKKKSKQEKPVNRLLSSVLFQNVIQRQQRIFFSDILMGVFLLYGQFLAHFTNADSSCLVFISVVDSYSHVGQKLTIPVL